MDGISKPVLDVLRGKAVQKHPIWLMRQAGRYLPEYRELRKKAGCFLNLCQTPEWAAEVTLQPVRRFNMDAAILFADILLLPLALGQSLQFKENEGPSLPSVQKSKDLEKLCYNALSVEPTFETIRLVKQRLPKETAFIGFSGGLWTVACYMIDGGAKGGFSAAINKANEEPAFLDDLFSILLPATFDYLERQVQSGVEVIQLFESHAGLLTDRVFDRFVIEPTKKLVYLLKNKYPDVPLIGFPRGADLRAQERYFKETGVTALGIDQKTPLEDAVKVLGGIGPLQGNLDPEILLKGGSSMEDAVSHLLTIVGDHHIFNLGHGVIKETPPDHVASLVDFVHNYKRK